MSDSVRELQAVLSTFRATGPASFVLLEREYGSGEEGSSDGDIASADDILLLLQSALYEVLHCRGDVREFSAPTRLQDPHGAAQFVASLSAANAGRGRDSRWTVVKRQDNVAVAEYWGILFSVELPENAREGHHDGGDVAVRIPNEHQNVAPGFYVALSDKDDERDERPRVRVYWHVDASGAAKLVSALTRGLNEAGIAFRLKILADPAAFARADAATLYLAAEDLPSALPVLRETHGAVAEFLYPQVSLLALRLADGVSLAEDPEDSQSFGEHRCNRLARALTSVARDVDVASPSGFAVLLQRFEMSGIDVGRMYANPGSTNSYRWSAPIP